jgi:hypothetical protein
MSVEVLIKSAQATLPELPAGMRYIVARDGTYLERRTKTYHSSVKVKPEFPTLDHHDEFCRLACPPLPRVMLREMLGFFREAYKKHGGEAALVLLYHPEGRRYRWWCPPQQVQMHWWGNRYEAGDSVQFQPPDELPEGYIHFGDAHSHHGSPVPSFIDRDDEEYQDGLHLIIGNIAREEQTWHIDFCIDGQRFTLQPPLLIESLPPPPYLPPPAAWMEKITMHHRPRYTYYSSYRDDDDRGRKPKGGKRYD